MMANPIPVLFYAPYSQNFTGGPREFLKLIEHLDKNKFDPICIIHKSCPLSEALSKQNLKTIIVPFPQILDVYNERIFSYSPIEKLRSGKALLDYNKRIKEIGRQYQVQAIWGRNVKSILLTGIAAHQLGVPLIWDIGMEKESRGLVRFFHWLGLIGSTVVVTQASSQPRSIFDPVAARLFKTKFITIPPGTSAEKVISSSSSEIQSKRSSDRLIILTVGSINPRKNQLMLLRAIYSLIQTYPQLQVKIVGPVTDEAYFATCQKFVDTKGLKAHVTFLGWCDQVAQLMSESDLFVLCSNNEGVPGVIREAMYASLPIIATAVGGVPDTIKHGKTGFLIEKEDVDSLQKLIEYCLIHPHIRESVGKQAFEAAEQNFSVTEWSFKYNNLLSQLCHV